jgi:hypothetical protein
MKMTSLLDHPAFMSQNYAILNNHFASRIAAQPPPTSPYFADPDVNRANICCHPDLGTFVCIKATLV